jgi:hypothetical protein
MAVLLPLRIWQGETKVWRFTIWNDEDDTRLDLSAYTDFEFEVKNDTGDADPADISKNVASGIEVLTQSGDTIGQLEVTLTPPDTSALVAGVYKYDLWGLIGSERYLLSKPADFTIEPVVNGAT